MDARGPLSFWKFLKKRRGKRVLRRRQVAQQQSDQDVLEEQQEQRMRRHHEIVLMLAVAALFSATTLTSFRYRSVESRERYTHNRLRRPCASVNFCAMKQFLFRNSAFMFQFMSQVLSEQSLCRIETTSQRWFSWSQCETGIYEPCRHHSGMSTNRLHRISLS